MKSIALDTNIAIGVLNGNKDILNKVQNYEVIFLPVTVSGELLFGAKNSAQRKTNLKKFRSFIGDCEILEINNLVAEAYSDIRLDLKQKGKPIPENDIWIAAICIIHGIPLLTNDKHFKEIKGLKAVRI